MNNFNFSTQPFLKLCVSFFFFYASAALSQASYSTIAFHPVPLTGELNSTQKSISPSELNKHSDNTYDKAASSAVMHDEFLEKSIGKYQENIETQTLETGPFNPAIGQQLESLGDLFIKSGKHTAATEAYTDSLHIIRINEGLYSKSQEDILKKIIQSQIAANNIQLANETHQSLLHLQKNIYSKNDSAYIKAVLEWADWNVDKLLIEDSSSLTTEGFRNANFIPNLLVAQENYIEAIGLIREELDHSAHDLLIHAEKKLAAINYIANNNSSISRKKLSPFFNESSAFTANSNKQDKAEITYFFNGSNALKRTIAYHLESPTPDYVSIAEQMMALGDWNMLFNRRAAALSIYEDAYDVLDATQASESEISQVMTPGMPVNIPGFQNQNDVVQKDGFAGYIDVEFKVSKFGIASRPEVIGTSNHDVSPISKALIKKIRQEKFRPAFIDGSASHNDNVKLRYYYSYN